ncbi:MAG: hypothetical protein RIQ81_2107 [Pseudomonadota bacterium]|jgi:hypothetical protein
MINVTEKKQLSDPPFARKVQAFCCLVALWNCASPPPPKPAALAPSPTQSAIPTTTPATQQLYDVSGLGDKHPDLVNVPALDKCKSAGQAFIRRRLGGETIERCSSVTMESGWCNFAGISAKFDALGNVSMTMRGIPDMADVVGKKPSELLQALEAAGWLPDQCATNEGNGSTREPVVFLYRLKTGTGTIQADVLQVLPICLSPPKDATWTYKDKALCEI